MTVPAIRCHGLGKQYRLGVRAPYGAFRDVIATAVRRSLGRIRGERCEHPDTVWALRDVSFDVAPGEIVGVIGRNGAGKSTLLKLISRITAPTEGTAEIHGRVGSLLEVGTGFHPELTGAENVYLNGAILGMRRHEIARKFDDIIAFAEVERFVDTPVKHYSNGMYVRLAFSVAAHLEPEIFLVDEVLAVGDVSFQQKCLGRMSDVRQDGRTILFVSHNMAAIKRLCTRCLVIDGGRLAYDGDVETAIKKYMGEGRLDAERAEVDTVDVPRELSTDGQLLRITSVRLHSNTALARVPFEAPLSVTLEFDVRRPLRDVSWCFRLETLEGIPVVDAISVQSLPPTPFDVGRWLVTGTVAPNPLRPGTYRISAAAGSHGTARLDMVTDALRFVVEDDDDLAQAWEVDQPTMVRLRSSWKKPERRL